MKGNSGIYTDTEKTWRFFSTPLWHNRPSILLIFSTESKQKTNVDFLKNVML